MNIRERCVSACESYWNACNVLRNFKENDLLTNCKASAVALTYFTGIVPLLVLVVQQISLIGRVKVKTNVSDQDQKISGQSQKALNPAWLNETLEKAEEYFKDEPLKEEMLKQVSYRLNHLKNQDIKASKPIYVTIASGCRVYNSDNPRDMEEKHIEEKIENFFENNASFFANIGIHIGVAE